MYTENITRETLVAEIRKVLNTGISIRKMEDSAGLKRDAVRDFLRGKTHLLRIDKHQLLLDYLSRNTNSKLN